MTIYGIRKRYVLATETADECEWGTFTKGRDCRSRATYVILDTEDVHGGEAFHWAHLCVRHAIKGLNEANAPVEGSAL